MMGRIPNISNPTDAQRAAYAAAHGFKELRRTEKPGRYYAQGWHETAKLTTETWTAWKLTTAKKDARIGQAEDVDAVEEAIKQADALAAN